MPDIRASAIALVAGREELICGEAAAVEPRLKDSMRRVVAVALEIVDDYVVNRGEAPDTAGPPADASAVLTSSTRQKYRSEGQVGRSITTGGNRVCQCQGAGIRAEIDLVGHCFPSRRPTQSVSRGTPVTPVLGLDLAPRLEYRGTEPRSDRTDSHLPNCWSRSS